MGKINAGKFACLAEGLVTKIIISRGLSMTGTCNYYVTANNPIYSTMYSMAFPVSMSAKVYLITLAQIEMEFFAPIFPEECQIQRRGQRVLAPSR